MAITFTRDDNNPEAPAAIKPAGRTGWIETTATGEWTGKFSATKPAGAGSNWREVGYATVTLNDGRQFRAILDDAGQPISVIGDSIGQDDDQVKRWKDRQASANKPPEERNNNGRRERWNPQANDGKGAWEDVGPAINTSTTATADKPTIGRVEGTPMPDGTFDNTKPIWVERDPTTKQQVGPAKPLTQQQREQWEREKNGGLTDAEVRARNSPENQVGKPTGNTRTKTEGNKTVKETEYLLPDGTKEWRTQEETAAPDRIGKPTGNTRQRNEGGKEIKETEYILPDGTKEWRVQEAPSTTNQPLPAGMPRFTPDPNKPALGLVEYAEQLAALRASGKLTDKQYQEFVGYAHQQASTEASRLDTITRAQQTQQTNEINQRTTDMQLSSNRLTAASSATQNALDTSLKMAGNFTNDTYRSAGGPILPAVMALQDMRAASWGGMNTPPPVTTAGYPALQQVGQMGLTPQQQPNTVIPAVAALANGGGAGAPPAAPAAAAARPPLWQPRTNMPTPNPPPAAPVAPGQSPPAAPVRNPALVNTDPHDGATPVAVPPAAPAQPAPAPSSPFVGGSVLPQPPDQMPVPVPYPTSPGAVSMQQPGVLPAVNTLGIAAEVAAAGGYSPEVMQQAMRELGFM